MSKPPVVINAATVGSLGEFTPKPGLAGRPVASDRSAAAQLAAGECVQAGIWECRPGVFTRTVTHAEFSHFTAGHCIFTPEGGQPVEIRAGDAVYFPAECRGVWDVRETLRKSYIVLP